MTSRDLQTSSSFESIDLKVDCSTPSSVPAYGVVLARTLSEEAPDPRIQIELERLNASTDTINKLEVELDEARLVFRQLLSDSTQRIDFLSKKLGKCIQQARPYYDARIKAKQALQETQSACLQYERAVSEHTAAREMVFLAEEGLMQSGAAFDQTWQEMLNHASAKVNAAEKAKHDWGIAHLKASGQYQEAEARVQQLQLQLKRAIARSSLNTRRSLLQMSSIVRMQQLHLLPYFEAKSQVNQQLEWQKQRVKQLEAEVGHAKDTYSSALDALETISDQIHKRRQNKFDLGVRGVGVGAEFPSPLTAPERFSVLELTNASVSKQSYQDEISAPAATQLRVIKDEDVECVNNSASPENEDLDNAPGSVLAKSSSIDTETISDDKKPYTSERFISGLHGKLVDGACGEKSSEVGAEGGSSGSGGAYLSGWQLVNGGESSGAGGGGGGTTGLVLTVEEASMSDSESLASIEMLSDDAIAGLMLEEDFAELTLSSTPQTSLVTSPRRDVEESFVDAFSKPKESSLRRTDNDEHLLPSFKNNNPFVGAFETDILDESSSSAQNISLTPKELISTPNNVKQETSSISTHDHDDSIISVNAAKVTGLSLSSTPKEQEDRLSPARSPVRPSSLPLISRNSPRRHHNQNFITVHCENTAQEHHAETVVVSDTSTSDSTPSDCQEPRTGSGDQGTSSSLTYSEVPDTRVHRSESAWSPELRTPGYRPLLDTCDSPGIGPPPNFPPPVCPPPLPPRTLPPITSSSSSE